jgi:hypothetical protein
MSYAGLSLFGIAHMEIQRSACASAFSSAKGMLAGISIGLFTSLCLGGWLKDLGKKPGGKQNLKDQAESPETPAGNGGDSNQA